ncbi:MAG: hypothetical protein ACJAS9_002770 [Polaribacter sp.]|jgi:hypothetical protein
MNSLNLKLKRDGHITLIFADDDRRKATVSNLQQRLIIADINYIVSTYVISLWPFFLLKFDKLTNT